MNSRKRVVTYIAAILVGVPALLIAGFFAVVTLDVRRVEARTEICKALIPAVQEFRSRAGRPPSEIEAREIDPKLVANCGYHNSGEQFWMGLAGEGMNMQVYGYSSETNRWFWD